VKKEKTSLQPTSVLFSVIIAALYIGACFNTNVYWGAVSCAGILLVIGVPLNLIVVVVVCAMLSKDKEFAYKISHRTVPYIIFSAVSHTVGIVLIGVHLILGNLVLPIILILGKAICCTLRVIYVAAARGTLEKGNKNEE